MKQQGLGSNTKIKTKDRLNETRNFKYEINFNLLEITSLCLSFH